MRYLDMGLSNRSVHLGMIAKCNYNQNHGLLLGFRKTRHVPGKKTRDVEHKIFYFEKDLKLVIKENTLVSYLSYDYDNFSAKAENVLPLTDLIIHHDRRTKFREDRALHDDEAWNLINEAKPFIDYSITNRNCIVYYPIIEGDICYLYHGLWGIGLYWHEEAYIYKMFKDICENRETHYAGWPSFEQTIVIINELKNYVESINAEEIINTYTIERHEEYFTRPGKDFNFYDIYKVSILRTEDKYLQFLLPSKGELIEHDEVTSLHGYRTGVFPLKEEAEAAQEKAKSIYSKEDHFAYLLRDFFMSEKEKELTAKTSEMTAKALEMEIPYKFDIVSAEKVINRFQGTIDDQLFVRLLDDYNQL